MAAFLISLVLSCGADTCERLAVPIKPARPCLTLWATNPCGEEPEDQEPPHGEGSGELQIFNGLSASGTNTSAQVTNYVWQPESTRTGPVFAQQPSIFLKVGAEHHDSRRPFLPRARRNC